MQSDTNKKPLIVEEAKPQPLKKGEPTENFTPVNKPEGVAAGPKAAEKIAAIPPESSPAISPAVSPTTLKDSKVF